MAVVEREARKEAPAYRRHAVRVLGRVAEALRVDVFNALAGLVYPLLRPPPPPADDDAADVYDDQVGGSGSFSFFLGGGGGLVLLESYWRRTVLGTKAPLRGRGLSIGEELNVARNQLDESGLWNRLLNQS